MARWLKLFLCTLGVAGLALATLPWWLGVAARPILKHWGVTYERYERQGYAHFRLLGMRYANAQVEITVKQIQSATPMVWLARRLRGIDPIIAAEGWRIQRMVGSDSTVGAALRRDSDEPSRRNAAPTSDPSRQKTINGMPDLQVLLQRIRPHLSYWLPRVQLSAGELRDLGFNGTIAEASWQNSVLTVARASIAERPFAFVLTPAADGSFVLTAHTAENDARLRLIWTGAEINGEGALWDLSVQLSAHFSAQGWLPAEASAAAEKWQLPAARVKLGAPYAVVNGTARLTWHDNTFDLSLNAKAEPAAKTKAPPFEATAAAHGNLHELTLTALHVDAPFATAKLTAPVTFSVDRSVSAESAQLIVQADLAKLPWIEARGKVDGMVTVAGDSTAARETFALKFSDVVVSDFSVKSGEFKGVLAWPLMELTELKVQLDDSSSLETHGSVNWQSRELTGVAVAAKLGSASFSRWLPPGATWTTAVLSATAEGPLTAPRHQGSLKLTAAQWPPLHPLMIDTSWLGVGTKWEVSARATAEKSALDLAGTLEPHSLQLNKFRFTAADQVIWNLTMPARFAWSPAWKMEALQLSGSDSQLTLKSHDGPDGTIELAATHFNSVWLQDWLTLTGPGWQIQSLQATGHAANHALNFDATLSAQIEMSPQPAQVKLSAHGDDHGIDLKEFKVVEAERVLTQATGRLPLVWRTEAKPHLSFDETAPLELSASTEPDSPLWATLSAATGLQLTRPTAKINLKGTLRQPVGDLQVNVVKLGPTPGRFKQAVPEFDDLALAINFAREKIILKSLSGKIDGQEVQAGGQVPMDDDQWEKLWHTPAAFDWSKAAAQIDIADADLAAFAQRWPNFAATQGHLSAHVELAPGKQFRGELHLTDAASRPLPALGALRDIKADLVLADRLIAVRTMTAKLGSEPVTLDGSITLAPGGAPRLALGLKGRNLPLVRNTGLLLRSDLDLHADTDNAGLTRLSGMLTVRDCLVLANVNLKTLLPTGLRGVILQPPYFAVEAEPFRHWSLAVEVRAPGAIRVRTTAYNGTASAHFQLGGTLGEPRAVGELIVDRGQMLFPFATFTVQQGAVRLREADPFHAVVSLNATSLRRDYQMRLEMKGELPTPNVTITSTPALEAADVLLMVMTGQQPAGDTTTAASAGPRLALLGAYLGRGLFQDLGFGGEDRLEISSGEHVSRLGRETYEFEYKLGKKWSLSGEYDQFDSYNAGVKWHVYTEESKPVEKK